MNALELVKVCKKAVRDAYQDFKHYMNNPLFELSDNIYFIHLEDMKKDAGTKVNKWYFNGHDFSESQYKYVKEVEAKYLNIAIRHAYKYSKRFMK